MVICLPLFNTFLTKFKNSLFSVCHVGLLVLTKYQYCWLFSIKFKPPSFPVFINNIVHLVSVEFRDCGCCQIVCVASKQGYSLFSIWYSTDSNSLVLLRGHLWTQYTCLMTGSRLGGSHTTWGTTQRSCRQSEPYTRNQSNSGTLITTTFPLIPMSCSLANRPFIQRVLNALETSK